MLRQPQEANANREEIQLGERPHWGSAGTVTGRGGRQGSAGREAGQHREGGGAAQGGRVCSVRGVAVLREGLQAGGGGSSTTGTEIQKLFPQHFTECSGMDMGCRPVSPSPHASPQGFPTTPVNNPQTETPSFSPSLCIIFISQ